MMAASAVGTGAGSGGVRHCVRAVSGLDVQRQASHSLVKHAQKAATMDGHDTNGEHHAQHLPHTASWMGSSRCHTAGGRSRFGDAAGLDISHA